MGSPALESVLALQEVDTKIDQLRHKEATHPLRAELKAAEAKLAAQQKVVDEVAGRHHEVERQQKRADDEVATVRARRDETEAKMYDGSVTGVKELQAMQEESKHLLERQTELEDAELVIMEALETISKELQAASGLAADLERQRQTASSDLEAALAEVVSERTDVEGTRGAAVEPIPAELLETYERLRNDLGGVAAARLQHDTCQGCFLNLSAVTVDQIKKSAADAVVNCDQCGRILVR